MPDISTFTGGIAQTNAWLFDTGAGVILVDAPEGAAGWVASLGHSITALLLTHQHFDHVQDAAAIREQHHCPIFAFADYSPDLTLERLFGMATGMEFSVPPFQVDVRIGDQQRIEVGGTPFEVLHIPGHSPDSVCFHDAGRRLLFGGDVLFHDGVGRTDFPGGSWPLLLEGIQNRLLKLSDDTRVLPGHGPETTIGRERAANPFLQ